MAIATVHNNKNSKILEIDRPTLLQHIAIISDTSISTFLFERRAGLFNVLFIFPTKTRF